MKSLVFSILIVITIIGISINCAPNGTQIPEIKQPIVENISQSDQRKMVVSHNTLDSNYLEYTQRNHNAYTSRQGYDYWFRNGNIDNGKFSDPKASNKIFQLGLYWQKIAAVEDALNLLNQDGSRKYGWVIWVDADAFFTDMNTRFEDIIAQAKPSDYFIIARDYPGSDCINAGVFLVKNNEQGRNFINQVSKVFDLYKTNAWPEQQAIVDLIFQYLPKRENEIEKNQTYQKRDCNHERILAGVKVVPQRTMNSFYSYIFTEHDVGWRAGDFIAHMAGPEDKVSRIKRLMSCMAAKGGDLTECEPL
jgi:hypothetical protein